MLALKRGLDVALALLLLVCLLPLLAGIAIVVWLETGSPVFFHCRRIGRQGRVFTMYKFRTMAVGAPAALPALRERNLAQGMVKIADDPRVTRVGRVLRRFSLDELPQLWNVMRGDMSLVGPRPHEVGEVPVDDPLLGVRFRMRPGLTGLWQIKARSNPSLALRVRYDLDYITRWSWWVDLRILAATIPLVLRGEGGQVSLHLVDGHDLVAEITRDQRLGLQSPVLQGGEHRLPLSIT